MDNSLNISRLSNDDIEELIYLINSAYRGESSKEGWTTEADLLDGLRTNLLSVQALIRKPGAIILSAINGDNRMVGCVHLQEQGRQLYLGMLTVAPDLQGKGIGKQLLLAAETYALKNNCTSILMSVIAIRNELIDWYKRHGFFYTGETKPFPTDPQFGIPKQPLQIIVLEKIIRRTSTEE